MSRRIPLLVLGIALAAVVAVVVVLLIRTGRGTPVELPVAIEDVPPGTELSPSQFRLEEVRGLSRSTLDACVTADEFTRYVGLPTLETVHAGSPVLEAQVPDPDGPEALQWRQGRLTLLLSDPSHLVYPLAVTADQVGNYVVAGDHVDVIVTLGRVAAQEMSHGEEVEMPPALSGAEGLEAPEVEAGEEVTGTAAVTPTSAGRPGEVYTTTVQMPVAKVVLPDVLVLRVEWEQVRSTTATYGVGTETQQATAEGDVVRLYLEVDREQAEILSFAAHAGDLHLPARAEAAGGTSEGFTWEDFVERFFAEREE
jgi:Flp pilus assembly protein CpaB